MTGKKGQLLPAVTDMTSRGPWIWAYVLPINPSTGQSVAPKWVKALLPTSRLLNAFVASQQTGSYDMRSMCAVLYVHVLSSCRPPGKSSDALFHLLVKEGYSVIRHSHTECLFYIHDNIQSSLRLPCSIVTCTKCT